MDKNEFRALFNGKFLILDGATGSNLQKKGMPAGICPEKWAIENPNALIDLQEAYASAGSDVVYTFTLGANPVKLAGYSAENEVYAINKKLAEISLEAVNSFNKNGRRVYVAGCIGLLGESIKPMGTLLFDDAVSKYKEQVRGLLAGGVDFFIIETMINIQDARAALIAVKEICKLPVCVSMTFEKNGRTLTGTTPAAVVLTLQSLGADAIGCNCSTGPDLMIPVIKEMKKYANVPLLAKPNAGLPQLVDGQTVFSMGSDEFVGYVKHLAEAGANMIGGCCGTNESFIDQTVCCLNGVQPVQPGIETNVSAAITTPRRIIDISDEKSFPEIGIVNAAENNELMQALKDGDYDEALSIITEIVDDGAEILKINLNAEGVNEELAMSELVELISFYLDTALLVESSNPEAVGVALRKYPGRAIFASVASDNSKNDMDVLVSIAKKYGAFIQ